MLDQEKVKETMYQIFRETDAVRAKLVDLYNRTSGDLPMVYVCKMEGNLLLHRITEATSTEECRGYVTELITCLSVFRLLLDEAEGITHGSSPKATNEQTRQAVQSDLHAVP